MAERAREGDEADRRENDVEDDEREPGVVRHDGERLAEEDEERLAQRPPRELQFNNGKQNIFYVANNTSPTFCIPVHLQRYMLIDYCEKKNLSRDYELFDLEDMLHCPTLVHLVEDRNANLVMYSIFALPEVEAERNHMLETALKRGSIIHFVNEDLQLVTREDLDLIKRYLTFAKFGHSRLPIGLPLSHTTRNYFDKWSHSVAEHQ